MKLLWSAFALADRDGIFTHIQADNPRAAIAVDERIAAAARRLIDFPESGRPGRSRATNQSAKVAGLALVAMRPDQLGFSVLLFASEVS